MPYIIDSITAQTIDVNGRLTLDGQEIITPKYYNIGNSSENTNIDWSDGLIQEINLDNNPTLTFSNGLLGQSTTLLLKQQTEGLKTITWPNNVIWNGGNEPTMQTLAGAGSIDTSFEYGSGFTGGYTSSVIKTDGKILVGGSFSSYSGVNVNNFVVLNTDGSIDDTFNFGSGFNSFVSTLAGQSDGKILVGGSFTSYDSVSVNRLVRLNTDGSIDNTFDVGTGFNGSISRIVIDLNNRIIVSGSFTSYDGVPINGLVRLNTDGSIDNTFDVGTGFNGSVYNVAIDSNGKIIFIGDITLYNGNSIGYIVRLNSDGTIDNTFNTGTGFDYWSEGLFIQSDNKIIVAGYFEVYNGTQAYSVIRLNSDGTIDTSFNPPISFFQQVQFTTVFVQSDGKVVLGGGFSLFTNNNIIRLNSDGSVDSSLNIGSGTNNAVKNMVILSDGAIIFVGFFNTYNSISANGIVKIFGDSPLSYNITNFEYNGTYYIGSF
jgi:uncharacterized delta-60 repeat protein